MGHLGATSVTPGFMMYWRCLLLSNSHEANTKSKTAVLMRLAQLSPVIVCVDQRSVRFLEIVVR